MTLQIYGPRAQEFVDLLAQFTGLRLMRTGEAVTVSRDTLLNPSESETLQDLVFDIVSGTTVVRIAAFSTTPGGFFSGDWFFPHPGHILREYFGAARPPGQLPGAAFANYHVPAILTEAQIASDLTGHPIWTGTTRPWEHTYGNINVRSYGPGLKFQLVMSAAGELMRVIQPTGI